MFCHAQSAVKDREIEKDDFELIFTSFKMADLGDLGMKESRYRLELFKKKLSQWLELSSEGLKQKIRLP